jgi:alpha-L-arabinofuranosidase
VSYLDVSVTHNKQEGTLYLNVLNKSESRNLTTRIHEVDGKLTGEGEVWYLNHGDFKTAHTFGDDQKVRPTVSPLRVKLDGNGFTHTFPAHSLSIVKLKLRA